MSTTHRAHITRTEIAGSIVVLALVIVFLQLCLWQVRRMHERRASNAGIAARMHDAPLASAVSDTTGMLYRRVIIHGRFDDARAIVLPGRSLFGSPGVHIVTPLLLADGSAVLVNRGWVPSADGATVEMKMIPTDSGAVTGLVLPFPGRSASVSARADSAPPSGTFRRVWYAIDESALRAQFPYALAPMLVQMSAAQGDPQFPKRLPPPQMDEGPHLSYALQWLAFAIITAVGWITFVARNRAERGGARVVRAPPHPPRI